MAKKASKKTAGRKTPAKPTKKKSTTTKKITKVIDTPAKTVFYKQGDLIDGLEILEEAAARTKKKDPMPFDIQWETADSQITLHVTGGVTLEKKKK